jgi:hypothetical protein
MGRTKPDEFSAWIGKPLQRAELNLLDVRLRDLRLRRTKNHERRCDYDGADAKNHDGPYQKASLKPNWMVT